MKASDVVNKLTLEVHKHTDLFSDVVTISSIVRSGTTTTITTSSAHGLLPGKGFYISDAIMPITISSLTRAGTTGTLVTATDHDLTLPIAPTIQISGAANQEFNGTFTTINILNRRTITFTIANSGPTSTTGAKLLGAARYDQEFNGFHQVDTVVSPTSFTYLGAGGFDGAGIGGKVKTNLRVTAAASMERVVDAFTKQATNKAYLFVVLGDVSVANSSKSQDIAMIAGRAGNYMQLIKETVGLFVICGTKEDIGGRYTRDLMSDLLPALTKSICFFEFPSSLYNDKSNPLVFVSHANRMYDSAIYVHEFIFEATSQMLVQDTIGSDPDVALRNIDMTLYPDLDGTGFMHTNIDLDEEPL